jgi:hypothetical protein
METAAMSIYRTTARDGREPITITVPETKRLSGLGHTKLWELIGDGTLETVSVGRRRLVIYASLCKLLTPETSGHDGPRFDQKTAGQSLQQPRRRRGRPGKVPANEATA